MLKIRIIVFIPVFIILLFVCKTQAAQCDYWNSKVGGPFDKTVAKINEKDPKRIIEGIECLLKLQGNRSRGAFSGATHNAVSQLLPQASVEICALYYISILFYEKHDHASGVVLYKYSNDKRGKFNSKKAVKKAYKSYRKWFKKVKEIGLKKARKQKLDPLKGSGVTWY